MRMQIEQMRTEVYWEISNFSFIFYLIATISESYDSIAPVLTLNAIDPDEGSNAEVEYEISASSPAQAKSKFRIDRKRGEIYLTENLDYETQREYMFQVVARDLGKNIQRSSETSIIIFGVNIELYKEQ